jgi:hypothetical protein
MNNSISSIAARVLVVGVSLASSAIYGQQVQHKPMERPQIMPMPTTSPQQGSVNQPMPGPVYQPMPVYQPPMPVYQQAYGVYCYAGQIIGTLAVALPVGSGCIVYAYDGTAYQGLVGQ